MTRPSNSGTAAVSYGLALTLFLLGTAASQAGGFGKHKAAPVYAAPVFAAPAAPVYAAPAASAYYYYQPSAPAATATVTAPMMIAPVAPVAPVAQAQPALTVPAPVYYYYYTYAPAQQAPAAPAAPAAANTSFLSGFDYDAAIAAGTPPPALFGAAAANPSANQARGQRILQGIRNVLFGKDGLSNSALFPTLLDVGLKIFLSEVGVPAGDADIGIIVDMVKRLLGGRGAAVTGGNTGGTTTGPTSGTTGGATININGPVTIQATGGVTVSGTPGQPGGGQPATGGGNVTGDSPPPTKPK